MPKILSSLSSAWSKCRPLISQRHFGSEVKSTWNEPPSCGEQKMLKTERKCHPKEDKCPAKSVGCPQIEWPKCYEPDVKPSLQLSCCSDHRLTENACKQAPRKVSAKEEKPPFKSMWETDGLQNQCPDAYKALDETHYKSSDKLKRIYTQTWKSCEPKIIRRKVCFPHELCMMPPLEKRQKQECPQTAKEQDSEKLKKDFNILKKCLTENPNTKRIIKCRKIVMPCCVKVTKHVKCHRDRQQSDCLKECCPHPSFSECEHPSIKQRPPVECRCSHFENQCVASRYLARKEMFELPPVLPAWPPKERPK